MEIRRVVVDQLNLKSTIFWDITSCSLLKANWRFRGTHRLHLQGRIISRVRNQRESSWQAGIWAPILDLISVNFSLSSGLLRWSPSRLAFRRYSVRIFIWLRCIWLRYFVTLFSFSRHILIWYYEISNDHSSQILISSLLIIIFQSHSTLYCPWG
jgi:hypothetical protein